MAFLLKDKHGMANTADPDHTDPRKTVCSGLSVLKHRSFMGTFLSCLPSTGYRLIYIIAQLFKASLPLQAP